MNLLLSQEGCPGCVCRRTRKSSDRSCVETWMVPPMIILRTSMKYPKFNADHTASPSSHLVLFQLLPLPLIHLHHAYLFVPERPARLRRYLPFLSWLYLGLGTIPVDTTDTRDPWLMGANLLFHAVSTEDVSAETTVTDLHRIFWSVGRKNGMYVKRISRMIGFVANRTSLGRGI